MEMMLGVDPEIFRSSEGSESVGNRSVGAWELGKCDGASEISSEDGRTSSSSIGSTHEGEITSGMMDPSAAGSKGSTTRTSSGSEIGETGEVMKTASGSLGVQAANLGTLLGDNSG